VDISGKNFKLHRAICNKAIANDFRMDICGSSWLAPFVAIVSEEPGKCLPRVFGRKPSYHLKCEIG
jgi:hypothetical protein